MGGEHVFLLSSELATALPDPRGVREARAEDVPKLLATYERHSVRVLRTAEELGAMLDCPDMTTLVVERGGGVVAYACRGRGADLGNVVHEWGGDDDDVLALVRAHIERSSSPGAAGDASGQLFCMVPPAETELAYRLATLGAPSNTGMLGMGKILDPAGAAQLLQRALGPTAAVEFVPQGSVGAESRPYRFRGAQSSGDLDEGALMALLFGPPEVRDDVRMFLEEHAFPRRSLPLEPFAWGLDSI